LHQQATGFGAGAPRRQVKALGQQANEAGGRRLTLRQIQDVEAAAVELGGEAAQ